MASTSKTANKLIKDCAGRIVVDPSRNLPPHGDGTVVVVVFKILKDESSYGVAIVNIFDVDVRKIFRCSPGGRTRLRRDEGGKSSGIETDWQAAIAELFEETGILFGDNDHILYPVVRILKHTRDKRDEGDKNTGKSGQFFQTVFAVCENSHKFELGETTDPDAEDPRRDRLEDILRATKENNKEHFRLGSHFWRHREEAREQGVLFHEMKESGIIAPNQIEEWDRFCALAQKTWHPTHILALTSALKEIGGEILNYAQADIGDLDEDDLPFLRSVRDSVAKITNSTGMDLVGELQDFGEYLHSQDPHEILTDIVGEAKAESLLRNHSPESLRRRN